MLSPETEVAPVSTNFGIDSVIYFELDLGPTTGLSNDPRAAGRHSHWEHPVWILPEPLAVRPGDPFDVTYRYGGMTTEVRCTRNPDARP